MGVGCLENIIGTSDIITTRIKQVLNIFGSPVAFVRDLGRGMRLATDELVAELDNPVPIIACHFHFLKDIGKDLLNPWHSKLRDIFRQVKIRPNLRRLSRELGKQIGHEHLQARKNVQYWLEEGPHTLLKGIDGLATIRLLCQWVLDYSHDSSNLEFPFEQPYLDFYNRCLKMHHAVKYFYATEKTDRAIQRNLEKLTRILAPIVGDSSFYEAVSYLQKRVDLFNRIRKLLRMPTSNSRNHWMEGFTAQKHSTLQLMEQSVADYIQYLQSSSSNETMNQDFFEACELVLDHFERHNKYLWNHLITYHNQNGIKVQLVDRTNNLLEDLFKEIKRKERRRSGRKFLSQDLEQLPAAASFTINLTRPDYVNILCGDLSKLPQLFSKIDATMRQNSLLKIDDTLFHLEENIEAITTSFPYKDRLFVRKEELLNHIEFASKIGVNC